MEAEVHQSKKEVKAGFERQIAEFFSHYSIQESQETLWLWFKATISGNYCRLHHLERDNLICFYEELNELIEAAGTLQKQAEEKKIPIALKEEGPLYA